MLQIFLFWSTQLNIYIYTYLPHYIPIKSQESPIIQVIIPSPSPIMWCHVAWIYPRLNIPPATNLGDLPWKDPPFLSSVKPGKPSINRSLPSISMNHLYHGKLLVITRGHPFSVPQGFFSGFFPWKSHQKNPISLAHWSYWCYPKYHGPFFVFHDFLLCYIIL